MMAGSQGTAALPVEMHPTRIFKVDGCTHITDVVRAGACIGCGGCAVASQGAYRIGFGKLGMYQAEKTAAAFVPDEDALATVCPFSNAAENEDQIAKRLFPHAPHAHPAVGVWQKAYVGWATEGAFRQQGSSGGITSWLLAELLRLGVIDGVIHVVAHTPTAGDRRLFKYRLSQSVSEVHEGAKSRYYPIEFSEVLSEVRTRPGRYAFVGIPCFVKAIRLLMQNDEVIRARIKICIGLFCGHLKSAALIDSFALQSGLDPHSVRAVDFRVKQPDRRADVYTVGITGGGGAVRRRDWARMVDGDWGMGFFQYSACNYCDDVMAETADVSFGDAWVPPYSADGQGTNVIVIRSPEIDAIFQAAVQERRLELQSVDGEFLAKTQAAGLRQRREGLAYRLYKRRGQPTPRKRVAPDARVVGWKRRRIYDLRMAISHWSHRVFAAARALHSPWLYRFWARCVRTLYRTEYLFGRGGLRKRLFGRLDKKINTSMYEK
jgi:coenzyme F420-reducing hydrogenase beta subunit